MKSLPLLVLLSFALCVPAQTPLVLGGSWYEISISSEGVPAIGCSPLFCQPSAAGNSTFAGNPPWTFIAPAQGANLAVTDAYARGEYFTVFDFGVAIGTTPPVLPSGYCKGDASTIFSSNPDICYADPLVSHGVFRLLPGAHSITVLPHNTIGVTAAYLRVDVTGSQTAGTNGLRFVPLPPCRVVDTRPEGGMAWPFGPPFLAAQQIRGFPIRSQACSVPPTARAYSLNVTVVPKGPLYYLTVWPSTQPMPLASTLNSLKGEIVANASMVPAGDNGAVYFYSTDATDLVLDINGYFDSNNASLSLYVIQPCRAVDTRLSGGPLAAGETRTFSLVGGPCLTAPAPAAYSLNVTAVPQEPLGYLTLWPTMSGAMPLVSTLNSLSGQVKANAAIVPNGPAGGIATFASNRTDVVLDMNGYFAPPGLPGALSFYPVTPCRVADTRFTDGPALLPGASRNFAIGGTKCAIPITAAAYVLNATVVPEGPLSYLTLWPAGTLQPFVSTLNSIDGSIVANAAVVPAGSGGAVSAYATDRTHLVLDISGYFAPAASLDPLPVPFPLSPPNGAILSNFPRVTTLNWLPVPGASQYGVEVQYCDQNGLNCVWLLDQRFFGTSFTFTFVGLQQGRWRVWAIDEVTGRVSFLSDWVRFVYVV